MAIRYTKKEEIWNASSHGGGILLGVIFGVIFLVWCFHSDNNWARVGVILYLFGMLGSYIASTLYHALPAYERYKVGDSSTSEAAEPSGKSSPTGPGGILGHRSKWKERLRKWDHAAIYWHIAGSYSPLTLTALLQTNYQLSILHCQLSVGWSLFSFVWACAIAGTIVSFIRLKEHSNVETFCFVGMGLSILVAFKPLMDSVSAAAIIWLIAEGVCYISGAVFYSLNKKKYMHSVFHFFVLAGSVCHIIAVWDVLMEQL